MADFVPKVLQSTALEYGSDSTTTSTIDNLLAVTIPDQPTGEFDYTHLTSTLESFGPCTVQKAGELAFTCHYSAAQLNTLVSLRSTSKYWKIQFPDTNGYMYFQGFLRDIQPQAWDDPNTPGEIDCMVRLTSTITLTPGS